MAKAFSIVFNCEIFEFFSPLFAQHEKNNNNALDAWNGKTFEKSINSIGIGTRTNIAYGNLFIEWYIVQGDWINTKKSFHFIKKGKKWDNIIVLRKCYHLNRCLCVMLWYQMKMNAERKWLYRMNFIQSVQHHST